MTRILFVVNDPANFVTHRLPVARAARTAGYQVEVATPPGAAVDAIRAYGFGVHLVPLGRRSLAPWGELASVRALTRLYARERPDLVHHATVKPIVYGGHAARRTRIRAAVHAVTGLGWAFVDPGVKARAVRRVVLAGYRRAFGHPNCRVIFQNADDESTLRAAGVVDTSRAVLIRGSGIDVDAFLPTPEPEGPPVVVLPARLLRDKGVREFVDAARALRAEGVQARFALVGAQDAGNPASISDTELKEWTADGVVEAWGWRSDMRAVLAHSHVVCLPSYREGVPRALLEAAACGRAMVATDVPGCRDVVVHGRTGLLVPPRDSRALADALRTVLTDASARARLGRAAREHAEREFSTWQVADATLAVYAELLS